MKIRLDKYLADSGLGTRSAVRSLLRSGSVFVNGIMVKDAALKIDTENDKVFINGKELSYEEYEYYMLSKPAGVITATRDVREKTVVDLIESRKRRDLFPVGRLDRDTEGLLIITNDGKLAHDLLSPSKHISKTYYALVSGELPQNIVEQFREGVDIGDEELTKPAELVILDKVADKDRISPEEISEVEITIYEGRYHEIKRMFEAFDCKVEYLKRLSMGELMLDTALKPGEYRELTTEEINLLKNH